MKRKTVKAIQGSVSVLLIIILLPMMTMAALVVDTSRINMARSMISSAGDLAMNSALADYDTILKDVYGLFAVSQNYEDDKALSNAVREYFEETLISYGVTNEAEAGDYVSALLSSVESYFQSTGSTASNFLQMVIESGDKGKGGFSAGVVKNSSLANSDIMKKQIVEYMKYRAPLNIGLSFLDSLNLFKTIEEQNEVIQTQVAAQESVQTVATCCKALIEAIRLFDKMQAEVDGSGVSDEKDATNPVKGLNNSTDGQLIKVADYKIQLDKYMSAWKDNYKHINRLSLVFLLKAPDVTKSYLYSLKGTSTTSYSTPFIKLDANNKPIGVTYSNSGINVSVDNYSKTSDALSKFKSQNDSLSQSGTFYKNSRTYINQNYLPYDNLVASQYKDFASGKENSAISSFVGFENMLANTKEAAIKYDSVKAILEAIYKLGKYFDNYNTLISAEIDTAKKEYDAAKAAKENAEKEKTNAQNAKTNGLNNINFYKSTADSKESSVRAYISAINNNNKAYKNRASDFADLLADCKYYRNNYADSKILSLLNSTYYMPSSATVCGNTAYSRSFYNFNYYLTNRFAAPNTSYLKANDVYRLIYSAALKSDEVDSSFISKANTYLTKHFGSDVSFKSFMGKSFDDSNDTCALFNYLSINYRQVHLINIAINGSTKYSSVKTNYIDSVNSYIDADSRLATAKTKVSETTATYNNKKDIYDNKVSERNNNKAKYEQTLSLYADFTSAYQTDLSYYTLYQTTAKNIVGTKAAAIKAQITQIEKNIKALKEQLKKIDTECGNTETAINTYQGKVNTWKGKTDTYVSKYGADSFTDSNMSNIEGSKEEYNLKQLQTLRTYTSTIFDEYNAFYTYLTGPNGTPPTYGSKKISSIGKADEVVSAASSVKDSLPTVVSSAKADATFSTLFKQNAAPSIGVDQGYYWRFINNGEQGMVPLQFLVYLNTNYPEKAEDKVNVSTDDYAPTDPKADYESTKNSLKKGTEGSDSVKSNVSADLGYSYSDKSIKGENLPSKGTPAVSKGDTKFNITEGDKGSINASESFGSIDGILGTALDGISNALGAVVENAFVLSYIFGNFSHNTIVQEKCIDGDKNIKTVSDAESVINKNYSTVKDNLLSLSGYKINSSNDYINGAEIEYILYGNQSASKNVSTARAFIYAIRFAFNCIYAFTDASITGPAKAAGLAVQAATLGVVPYIVVQIVVELAAAAAESAIDLQRIETGISVPVVKNDETWSLGPAGLKSGLQSFVTSTATDAVNKTINAVNDGVSKVVDSTADTLKGSINDLSNDLSKTVETEANQITEAIATKLQSEIDCALNEIRYGDYLAVAGKADETVQQSINGAFDGLSDKVKSELNASFGGSKVGSIIVGKFSGSIDSIIGNAKKEVLDIYNQNSAKPIDFSKAFAAEMSQIREKVNKEVKKATEGVISSAESELNGLVDGAANKIKDYSKQVTDEMSEEATQKIKDGVAQATNDFFNEAFSSGDVVGSKVNAPTSTSASNSIASMFSFSYSDYLKLFLFLKLSTNSGDVLLRTADLIQTNIQKAGENAEFKHKKGNAFLMKNACTYVTIDCDVKLNMLFLNLDFFSKSLGDETTVTEQLSSFAKIHYHGLAGY